MSSPGEAFECRWQASRRLLTLYLATQGLAQAVILLSGAPLGLRLSCMFLCLLHGAWVLPRRILLSSGKAFRALRHGDSGWHLWSERGGWCAVQLRPDSLALPMAVILRFRQPGERFSSGICIPRDALSPDQHRRLRVRLKFARRRWAAPG